MAGKGLGTILAANALDSLIRRGFKELILWVFKANESAQKLYGRLGFTTTGVSRTDDRWQIPEIEMISIPLHKFVP